jgi:hypothetical protein
MRSPPPSPPPQHKNLLRGILCVDDSVREDLNFGLPDKETLHSDELVMHVQED